MITITVQSPIMEIKRTFRKDNPSITFLKRVRKLHLTYAKHQAGAKPRFRDPKFRTKKQYQDAMAKYNETIMCGMLPLKINVEHIKPN